MNGVHNPFYDFMLSVLPGGVFFRFQIHVDPQSVSLKQEVLELDSRS